MAKYDFNKIDKKWARKWTENKVFSPDLAKAKDPYYALFMFPYPSAEGLHVGNFYAFTCVDVTAKFRKLQGRDVFEPIGWDAFGIHSENYALQIGQTPRKMLNRTIVNFRKQLSSAGLGCDWTREVDTTTPEYYKWTQWIFTKLFEKGMAYQKKALLNFCPSCKTVLADEQIEGGECERCGTVPEKKEMKQWFFKITAYAQRLLDELDKMDWSEITKSAQKNWIGRSEGAWIDFDIVSEKKAKNLPTGVTVFTTRPDTLFGATFFVMSPENPLVQQITTDKHKEEVENYIKKAQAKSELERIESKEKTGVFTGAYVINQANGKKIPVWVADYVLMGYGGGAIMAVPAHDQRDWDFAERYDLPKIELIQGGDIKKEAYTGDGPYINSGFLNDLETKEEGIEKMIKWLEERREKILVSGGERETRHVNYKLRDWCISRQRYWGPPVPVIYCDKCGTLPVPVEDLPVMLPELDKGWEPAGDGRGPLAKVKKFMEVKCPKCNGKAEREPDVMDNFLDSAWYFFRYISHDNKKEIFDKKLAKKWLPVDLYVGGNEHAVLHLMYTRFITMALHDLGLINFDDPFKRFRANGMILKDGAKMSKSKGNVINPEEYGEKVGYDALKTYLLFLGPMSEDRSFTDRGVQGTKRWVEKIYKLKDKVSKDYRDSQEVIKKLHQTIKVVTEDFEEQKYNTAIARLMELTNTFSKAQKISASSWEKFLALIAPFTPALSEELWAESGNHRHSGTGKNSIFSSKSWPTYDKKLAKDETIELVIQVNGKLRDTIEVDANISEKEAKKLALDSKKIQKWIEGKKVMKVIFVKGKLVNIVVK